MLPPVDPSSVVELFKAIRHHISKVITNGNESYTYWIFDYLANIVQHPTSPHTWTSCAMTQSAQALA